MSKLGHLQVDFAIFLTEENFWPPKTPEKFPFNLEQRFMQKSPATNH